MFNDYDIWDHSMKHRLKKNKMKNIHISSGVGVGSQTKESDISSIRMFSWLKVFRKIKLTAD